MEVSIVENVKTKDSAVPKYQNLMEESLVQNFKKFLLYLRNLKVTKQIIKKDPANINTK